MSSKAIDKEWVSRQVGEFTSVFPRYEEYSRVLSHVLKSVVDDIAPLSIVQTRVKSIPSFTTKILRKADEHSDPVRGFTDLAGARVIVKSRNQLSAVCDFIKEHFDVDWENSIDVTELLKVTEFGYRSIHYIVSIPPGGFDIAGYSFDIPKTVLPDESVPMKAEIQVRTMLEHAWCEFSHDVSYKSSFQLPSSLLRDLAGAAALVENADATLQRINESIERYTADYESFLTIDEICEEIDLLQIILEQFPKDFKIAHKLGKLAISKGDWQSAVDILLKYLHSGYQPILRNLGIAMCKLHRDSPKGEGYTEGQEYIRKAIDINPSDVNAISSLAGTWKGLDDRKAWKIYKQAYEIDPADPYVLGNFLEYEILNRKYTSIVPIVSHLIASATERCLEQIDVGSNYPWAYFDLAKFCLLNNKPYRSLAAYARGIQISTAPFMIQGSLNSLDILKDAVDPWYEWAANLLTLGRCTKFSGDDCGKQLKKLATKDVKPIEGSVVIVVGYHDRESQSVTEAYGDALLQAFKDYRGCIIAGGTNVGVSRLVGDIQAKYPTRVHSIGYVPEKLPADVKLDNRYNQVRKTSGSQFSPIQPLQYWADILDSGIDPSSVKVIGLGGNSISQFEYILARILGATVVILEEPELRQKMMHDPIAWSILESTIVMPSDPLMLRAYIGIGIPSLPAEIRESIAQSLHNTYVKDIASAIPASNEARVEWDKLPSELQESNRQLVDHMVQKLNEVGYALDVSDADGISPEDFKSDEIEVMAEMEHARWVSEKLIQGWTFGRHKDAAAKTNPLISPWEDLDEDCKDIDRILVKKLPKFLAGFKLVLKREKQFER